MIINVYKESNMTSHDVVNILTKHFHTKKIGHTGTLDPIATGVLICCLDSSTKLVNILQSITKEYIAEIKFGIKTDTGDITGNVIDTKPYNVNQELITNALNSFLGESIQEVPIYSAIKINGKKLYEYARKNEQVELPKELLIYLILN
jgi:tRNA pseudouridine55 synthase